MSPVRNDDMVRGKPAVFQCFHLFQQNKRIANHTRANYTGSLLMKDSTGQKMQNMFVSVYNKCMTCIVTTLKPHYHIRLFSENIHYFPFAFVTPLGAYHYLTGHIFASFISGGIISDFLPRLNLT